MFEMNFFDVVLQYWFSPYTLLFIAICIFLTVVLWVNDWFTKDVSLVPIWLIFVVLSVQGIIGTRDALAIEYAIHDAYEVAERSEVYGYEPEPIFVELLKRRDVFEDGKYTDESLDMARDAMDTFDGNITNVETPTILRFVVGECLGQDTLPNELSVILQSYPFSKYELSREWLRLMIKNDGPSRPLCEVKNVLNLLD